MHTQEDIRLAEQVRKALASYIRNADAVIVDVEHEIATLKGAVANETERQNALTATRSVPGVRNIIDHLRLAGQDSQTVGEYIDDAAITAEVKSKLLVEKNLSSLKISVDTIDGVVTLTGDVKSKEQSDRAAAVAKQVKGVKRVDNKLLIQP